MRIFTSLHMHSRKFELLYSVQKHCRKIKNIYIWHTNTHTNNSIEILKPHETNLFAACLLSA